MSLINKECKGKASDLQAYLGTERGGEGMKTACGLIITNNITDLKTMRFY
jgi:hypothetical protein